MRSAELNALELDAGCETHVDEQVAVPVLERRREAVVLRHQEAQPVLLVQRQVLQ